MGDAELARQCFVVLERARRRAPLSAEDHAALARELDAIAARGDSPKDIAAVCAEQLEWLRPGKEG